MSTIQINFSRDHCLNHVLYIKWRLFQRQFHQFSAGLDPPKAETLTLEIQT